MADIHYLSRPHPISNAGTYGYEEPVAGCQIDVTPALAGFRVWVGARVYRTFTSLSNAARCASALRELASVGALPEMGSTGKQS